MPTMDDSMLIDWLRRLKPEQMAAQLIMAGPDPGDDPDRAAAWLAAGGYGGLFLQWRHLSDRGWLAGLIEAIRERGDDAPRPLVATDEEGGLVSDLAGLTTTAPSPAALAGLDQPEYTFRAALAMGDKLRALGFNVVLAPGLDVNAEPKNPVIGTRSFGATPEVVIRHALPAIEGYARAGVAACVKHFPGHGATRLDSHHTLPEVDAPREFLLARDLPPFRAAIDGGIPMIMTAHVAYPAFDPTGDPATLSPEIVTGLLRQELRYDGVILSDDMEMEAVAAFGDPGSVALQAIEAGVDMLLYARDREMAAAAVARVAQALRRGEVSVERIAQSVIRLARLRVSAGQTEVEMDEGEREEILDLRHEELLREVSAGSITLIGGAGPDIPLRWKERRGLWVVPTAREPRLIVDTARLRELVEPLGAQVAEVGLRPAESERDGVMGRAARADYIVACSLNRAGMVAEQRRLIDALVTTGRPVILVALLDPRDVREFPSIRTRLATRGFGPLVLEGLIEVLLGQATPAGGAVE